MRHDIWWAALLLAGLTACGGGSEAPEAADQVQAAPATCADLSTVDSSPQAVVRGLCYGSEVWHEPTVGKELRQTLDFWPAGGRPGAPAPLIVWAHPNGMTNFIADGPDSPLYRDLVQPALRDGYAFASIEFRHPVVNEAIEPAPHLDVAQAVQFLRAQAPRLDIDPHNVFIVAQSRGSLGLWTALQDDMAVPDHADPVRRQSTRVRAVFAYQPQATYDGLEFADLFVADAHQDRVKAWWRQMHPQYASFGSAIGSVDAGDPPVLLRYADAPRAQRLTYADFSEGVDVLHYADGGAVLCDAYRQSGVALRCEVMFGVPRERAFDGYTAYFTQHLAARP
jgi:hypothetical protein